MPQGNPRNRSRGRRYRNRRRPQRQVAPAKSPRNDEQEKRKQPEETPDVANDEEDSKTTDGSAENGDPIAVSEDRGEPQTRDYHFRPDDRHRIEKIELQSSCTKIVEITTVSSLPLEATIGHIAGVGILETGIGERTSKDSTVMTISEPVEPIRPFGESTGSKYRSYEGEDDEWANRLEIREASDSDAEVDCGWPTIVEVESDVEKEPSGTQNLAKDHGLSRARNQVSRQPLAPQKKLAKSEAESATLMWDTVMPREVERKLRNFIEDLQLPSFSEELTEEDGRFPEKLPRESVPETTEVKSSERAAATSRRKTRKRANSGSHFANSFLDIIQEEGEKLSEDEAQHIRDFINEEISKYRREDKHSAERTANDGDPEEEIDKRVCDITISIDTSECDILESHDPTSGQEAEATNGQIDAPDEAEKKSAGRSDSRTEGSIDEKIGVSEIDAVSDVDEEKLANSGPEDVNNNNSSVENIPTGSDVNGTRHEADELPIQVEAVRGPVERDLPRQDPIDTHATDDRAEAPTDEVARSSSGSRRTSQNEAATSPAERRRSPPPPPPKRSSSFGHEPQRPPTPPEIDYISNSANIYQPLVATTGYERRDQYDSTNPLERKHVSCQVEMANERPPRRPELPKGGISPTLDRATRENKGDSPRPRGSPNISRSDQPRQVKAADTTSTTRNAEASAGSSIASSDIRDGDPSRSHDVGTLGVALANAASTEITCCEEGKPATRTTAPTAHERNASSSLHEDESGACGCPSAKDDSGKGSRKAGRNVSAMGAGQAKGDNKSGARPSSSVEDNSTVLQGPAGTRRCEQKPGGEKGNGEESTSSYHRERSVKSETSETRIIERREESSSTNQRDGPRNSKYSTWESRREERHEEEKYEEKNEETRGFCRRGSCARNSSGDEASHQRTSPSPESEPADLQGHDSSSSTASLSTVKHCSLEASLADISAINRETKDKEDSPEEPEDESLKRKLTLLKNDGLAGDASVESSESPQLVPYSPVEDLHCAFTIAEDASARAQDPTSKDSSSPSTVARPSSLRELCVKKILSMPFGPQVINEITTPRLNIFESLRALQRFVSNVPSAGRDNARLNPHGVIDRRPGDLAGLTKATRGCEPQPNDLENAVSDWAKLLPESVNIETRLSDSGAEMERHWKGLSTSEDPRLLVCLSPSQQATSVRTSADVLLDLHRKFLNRYSYREEQPQCVPLPQYRVQVRPTQASSVHPEDDGAVTEAPRPPVRALGREAVGRPSNRLLEIIKEHSPGDASVSRNGPLVGRRSIMTNESLDRSCTFGGQERPKATRPSDCSNPARCDCRSAAANELFSAAARGEGGRDDKPGHVAQGDQSKIATRCIVGHRPSDDTAIARDSEPRPDASAGGSCARMEPGKKTPPWRTAEPGKHVNPALIDDKVEVPPLPKRAVTVDRSCIDTRSIFDQNPPRSHLEPRRGHETAEKMKHVAAAEIMDKLKKLQTETSRRLDVDRRASLPQEYFAQQLEYIELLEEQLTSVILAEEEERKAFEELQTHARRARQCDDLRKSSLADIPEEAPRKTDSVSFAREREIPVELRDGTTGGKCARSKQQESRHSGEYHLKSEKTRQRSEPEVQSESWREKSRNVGRDRTETIDKAGSRQFRKEVYHENGVHEEEESSESVEYEKCHVISGEGGARTPENAESRGNDVVDEKRRAETRPTKTPSSNTFTTAAQNVGAKRPSTLPTNGEAFRQRMYDEYVHKVLERQERKDHKVVKISSHEDIRKVDGKSSGMSAMAKEFIEKARSRLSKFGIDLDEGGTEREKEDEEEEEKEGEEERRADGAVIRAKCLIDGKELQDSRKLPKHLREFLKISTMSDDGAEGGELRRMGDGLLWCCSSCCEIHADG